MKIRTDFVTNSSSSSYCTVTINGKGTHRFDFGYQGFYTFWFKDPTAKLANASSLDDLLDAIAYSVNGEGVPHKYVRSQLEKISDLERIKSIDIEVSEEIEDRSWDDPSPRKVWYSYNFQSGEKLVRSDTPWYQYHGSGDSLAPVVRDLAGNPLPFVVEERSYLQCVLACDTNDTELVIPEVVQVDGIERTIRGLWTKCFENACRLKTITLPKTIERVAPDALDGCRRTLEEIRVEGVSEYPWTSVDGKKLVLVVSGQKELTVPDGISELGESALAGCWKLESLVLHDGMKKPTVKALSSTPTLETVILSDGSRISVANAAAKKCFTVSRGVIRFNYKKCAELMLDAGDAAEFKWAVEAGSLQGADLDEFYEKIKRKRKPEFKEMKDFILARKMAK